ncbi:MAG: PIN domain protein [Candidatus Raymondbacteria bacterium RifOxyB12_full_50_8]|nr:MAG: PIN domain protein [Candidatus Raymondbacteria bacterium RifOxyB12_full_50_8]
MRVYLDNCCLNRPFDDQRSIRIRLETEAKLFIQGKIRQREIELAWSYMIDYENHANPFRERRTAISAWRKIAVTDIEENTLLLRLANELVRMGLKAKDALHIACSIHAKCDYFLTTDDLVLRKSRGIKDIRVVDPQTFIREVGL